MFRVQYDRQLLAWNNAYFSHTPASNAYIKEKKVRIDGARIDTLK